MPQTARYTRHISGAALPFFPIRGAGGPFPVGEAPFCGVAAPICGIHSREGWPRGASERPYRCVRFFDEAMSGYHVPVDIEKAQGEEVI